MGQKTDTKNIFQIGKNNKKYIWDSKYFEKQKNESNIFIFQSMEIREFIEKILKDNGLILYKYRINFLESTVKIFISYLKLPKSQNIVNQIKSKKNININNFLEKIVESLNIFTNNKYNIILNLQQVNKNLTFQTSNHQLQHLKKIIIQLRQFKKSKFFKEGINTIFLSVIKKDSSQLLANFIANQLKLEKRHGFFLKFVKKTLSLMLTNKIVKAAGIKIIIKGRFNGKSRSGKKIITINKHMPLMTMKSKINSAQSTAYGPNGTFGIKVWINEKI